MQCFGDLPHRGKKNIPWDMDKTTRAETASKILQLPRGFLAKKEYIQSDSLHF